MVARRINELDGASRIATEYYKCNAELRLAVSRRQRVALSRVWWWAQNWAQPPGALIEPELSSTEQGYEEDAFSPTSAPLQKCLHTALGAADLERRMSQGKTGGIRRFTPQLCGRGRTRRQKCQPAQYRETGLRPECQTRQANRNHPLNRFAIRERRPNDGVSLQPADRPRGHGELIARGVR